MKPLSEKPNVEIIRPVARQRAILRIAPYCRVSSDSDDNCSAPRRSTITPNWSVPIPNGSLWTSMQTRV